MCRLRMESCLLLGAALLAGCSDRNTPTAPSARPLAATAALVDRPYTWSFTCHGETLIYATWWWTENGTAVASASVGCLYDESFSGTGVRPANANGFTACVGLGKSLGAECKSWTFDPAGPFGATLTGSVGTGRTLFPKGREQGKLIVDS